MDLAPDLRDHGFSLPEDVKREACRLHDEGHSLLEVCQRTGFAFLLHLISRNKSASEQPDSPPAFELRQEQNQKLVGSLRLAGLSGDAEKLEQCCTRFQGFVAPECHCSRAFAVGCGNRLCAHCQRKRAARIRESVENLFVFIKNPKFMTLTVPSTRSLTGVQIDRLRAIFTRFRNRKAYRERCRGGFFVFETTFGRNGWNLHIHFLADCDYWPQEELSREWESCGGGPIVDIRLADRGSIRYVGKYLSKGLELLDHSDRLVELYQAIEGKRLYGTVGNCYGANLEQSECPHEKEENFVCEHGNSFEFAGSLVREEVYLTSEGLWRIHLRPYLRLRGDLANWVTRSPRARAPS